MVKIKKAVPVRFKNELKYMRARNKIESERCWIKVEYGSQLMDIDPLSAPKKWKIFVRAFDPTFDTRLQRIVKSVDFKVKD